MGIFKKKEKKEVKAHKEIDIKKEIKKAEAEKEEAFWIKCTSCMELLYRKEVERNFSICPKCSYHFPISVEKRIEFTFEEGSFKELYENLRPVDFLKFKDTKPYKARLQELFEKTGRRDAVLCGQAKIFDMDVLCAIFDFNFMGGSLGSVVGEKITRLLKEGKERRIPVIVFCTSGGARMQEGIMSLMQMAKVTGAIYKLKKDGVPYITVLTDPTLGGVTASIAMLGDIIIAEPKAMIGFAGPRVIKETIKEELPPSFQRAEYLLEHGMIDMIVDRKEMKQTLHKVLSIIYP
ncbi:MAG: acetyl-CoA carboxylase, carboxyltransferase subunit beta [Desulfobacterota bacterium]|nr:acetyl-CoA carboxylase, carboxyltransferase subunit beta [Thermodesulfobacteriota bacterium]MDW8001798.1 acetyl-CoA carboxylase, carboxyltransferase subunit beta [Deltaproteobacteria bacterium]